MEGEECEANHKVSGSEDRKVIERGRTVKRCLQLASNVRRTKNSIFVSPHSPRCKLLKINDNGFVRKLGHVDIFMVKVSAERLQVQRLELSRSAALALHLQSLRVQISTSELLSLNLGAFEPEVDCFEDSTHSLCEALGSSFRAFKFQIVFPSRAFQSSRLRVFQFVAFFLCSH